MLCSDIFVLLHVYTHNTSGIMKSVLYHSLALVNTSPPPQVQNEMFIRTVAVGQQRRKSYTFDNGRRSSAVMAGEMERRKTYINTNNSTHITHPMKVALSGNQRRQSAVEGNYLQLEVGTTRHTQNTAQLFDIPELQSPRLSIKSFSSGGGEECSSVYRDSITPLSPTVSSRRTSRGISVSPITASFTNIYLQEPRVNFRLRSHLFQTFESTLRRFPDTLLGDKKKLEAYLDRKTNCYVLNRCHYTFNAVLFYYQSDGILSRPFDVDRENFIQEMQFYQIDECIDARHRQEKKMVDDTKRHIVSPKGNRVRQFIWRLLEYQDKTVLSQICFYFYLLTSIVAIVIFCAETEPQFKSKLFWGPLETAVNVLFSLEYVLRLMSAPSCRDFVFSAFGIVDLFAVVPFYCNAIIKLAGNEAVTSLSILTLLRVLRVFKLTRYNEGLQILMMTIYESLSHLRSLFVCIGITSVFFATLLYFIESDVLGISPDNNFKSIPDSFWYTVITATAVGYGDMYPKTSYGKFVGSVLASVGLLLFCLPTPMLVNKFVECYYIRLTMTKEIDPQRKAVIKRMRETFME